MPQIVPNSGLIELHYFPSLAWFSQCIRFGELKIEACEHYQKQSFRNRARILTANKVADLSVPVLGGGKQGIREVRIDHKQNWADQHWRTIQSAYGKSPFFEYYAADVWELIMSNEVFLFDLNYKIVTKCRGWLKLKTNFTLSESWEKRVESHILDLRDSISAKKPLSPILNFKGLPYYQVFGKDFAPNMSVLDLLFCEGPQANSILRASVFG
jgi:hypothetical protein